ncbi:transmembrane reductase CYB561D2-like [Culicoides brevitarsis]|uniref:transmembrane reductase CYB561D2-like n=1 Tax=Culicoides brevitarsis TaxID=469753 RepID=UPI00307B4F90
MSTFQTMDFHEIELDFKKESSSNEIPTGIPHQLETNQNKTSHHRKQQVDENSSDKSDDNDRDMTQNTETIGVVAMGLNGVTSLTLLLITGFISYLALINGVVLFSFHPIFMAVGYLVLMFQAILSMSDLNCWTAKLNYKQRVTFHWILQAASLSCITIGFVAIFVNKVRLGKEHFHTLHAIFGLITYILTIIVACGGIWTKYSFQLRKYLKPVYVKINHSLMGVVVFGLGITTACLGVYSKWFLKVSTTDMQLPLVTAMILCALYVSYKPMELCLKRITSSLRSSL